VDILIVDGSAVARSLMRAALRRVFLGSVLREAAGPGAAEEALERGPADLIALDLGATTATALSQLEDLLQHPFCRGRRALVLLPRLALPAVSSLQALRQLCFLPKPASDTQIRQAVESLLALPQPAPEA
jgi:DNA-binding NarL/FixJ family response regulator